MFEKENIFVLNIYKDLLIPVKMESWFPAGREDSKKLEL